MLEDALRPIGGRHVIAAAAGAGVVDPHDLARLDLAHALGADRVERARFARDTPVPLRRPTQHQRADAPGVADRLDPIGKQEQQAECALQVLQHVRERVELGRVRRFREQVDDDFGVGRALKNVAVLLVFGAQ